MTNFKSTTEKGNSLRDAVFSIVSTARKNNCAREKVVNGKAIDVYYEDHDAFRQKTIKFGIECKFFDKPLTRNDFDSIFSTYSVLLHNKAIDHLIIVSLHPPAPNVLTSIDCTPDISHHTYQSFSNLFMDFRNYLTSTSASFENEGLNEYYVPMLDTQKRPIEDLLNAWISTEDPKPRAILAGYGMGKTSLALKLARDLASDYLKGAPCRIPIYLKLGDIFNEQSLEGLVCKYFASKFEVPGFSYPLFLEYNRLGLFTIILDGFDEMKHAMSFSSFKSNIKEFNKLVVKKSKVIILGRPNAFTSENEKRTVLHGWKLIGENEIRDAEMRTYEEIMVDYFSRDQLNSFIPNYIKYLSNEEPFHSLDYVDSEFCENRITELLDEKHYELISRPVHARMFVQLALGTIIPLSSFTTYELYTSFFDMILERENSRPARNKISIENRQEFIENLAWTRWRDGGDRAFSFEDIEKQFKLSINIRESPKNALRELIIGSVIETKGDDFYYFSHRSFQEFLVARLIVNLDTIGKETIKSIDNSINPSILAFISESGNIGNLASNLLMGLINYKGEISEITYRLINKELNSTSDFYNKSMSSSQFDSPWHALFASSSLYSIGDRNYPEFIYKHFTNTNDVSIKLGILCGMLVRSLLIPSIKEENTVFILDMFHLQIDKVIRKARIHNRKISDFIVENELDRLVLNAYLDSYSSVFNGKNELEYVELDLFKLCKSLLNEARGKFYLSGLDTIVRSDQPKVVRIPIMLVGNIMETLRDRSTTNSNQNYNNLIHQDFRRHARNFWSCSPKKNTLVPLHKKETQTKNTRPILKLKA